MPDIQFDPSLLHDPLDPAAMVSVSLIETATSNGGEPIQITLEGSRRTYVDDSLWEQVRNYDWIQKAVSTGAIKEFSSKREGDSNTSDSSSTGRQRRGQVDTTTLPVKEVLDLIQLQHKVEPLEDLMRREKRVAVLNAAQKRINDIQEGRA